MAVRKIKVLVVDDSALVREILKKGLSLNEEIEVIAVASNPYLARDQIIKHNPDVMTLDIEMPKMNGIEFLEKLMTQYPIPTIMVSSSTVSGAKKTIDALNAGALDFVTKPSSNISDGMNKLIEELIEKIKIAYNARAIVAKRRPQEKATDLSAKSFKDVVVAIGASTGGTDAIRSILKVLPKNFPGIVVAQHMPKGFTKQYAASLNLITEMEVVEGSPLERISQGKVIVAPGDMHMIVKKDNKGYYVDCFSSEKVSGHMPSVDVLFESVANTVKLNALGIILTGMGSDGANGLKVMKDNGAMTFAQNKESCIVFGMPKVAIENGAVDTILDLEMIPKKLISILKIG